MQSTDLNEYKILIIDDEQENSLLIINALEKYNKNYRFYRTTSPIKGFEIALNILPNIIITDWQMPEMSGLELIQQLKATYSTKDIPVMLISGIMTDSKKLKIAFDAGAIDFIRKPFESAEIISRVKSILEHADIHKKILQQNKLLEEQRDFLHTTLEKLHEEERRFGLLFENSPFGIAFLDNKGNLQNYNKVFEKNLIKCGGKTDDLRAWIKNLDEQQHRIRDIFYECMKQNQTIEFEFKGKSSDQKDYYAHVYFTPVSNDYNQVIGAQVIIEDISERKINEFTLNKYKKAIEQTAASVVITDKDAKIEFVNPAYTQLTGYTWEETIGQNPKILKPNDRPESITQQFWQTLTAGNIWKGVMKNIKKNKEVFWEKILVAPIKNEQNEITHYIAVKDDITAQIQNEQKIQLLNDEMQKLSLVASKTVNGVIIMDASGNMEWINEGYERMYGYNLNFYNKNGIVNIKQISDNKEITEIIDNCITSKNPVSYEALSTKLSGENFWTKTSITPINDEYGKVIKLIAIDTDITQQKNNEFIVQQQKLKIEQSVQYARRIQKALFQSESQLDNIFSESFVLNKPLFIVSGDFYWYTEIFNKHIIAVADCTGHGIPGAFMSVLGTTFLTEISRSAQKDITPSEILNQLRDRVINSLQHSDKSQETKDGMDIALCMFDFEAMKLQYAGAYNPLYFIRNKHLFEIKANRMPIGISLKHEGDFKNNEIEIMKGDTFYLFSDGFIDQVGGPFGRKFLSMNFKEVLIEIQHLNLQQQRIKLEQTLSQWKGTKNEQVDDILVMGLKI